MALDQFTIAVAAPALLKAFLTTASRFNQAEIKASHYLNQSYLKSHLFTNLIEYLICLSNSVLPSSLTL